MDIKDICRVAGPDADEDALEAELKSEAPLSLGTLGLLVAYFMDESRRELVSIFTNRGAPPLLGGVWRCLVRGLQGQSGRDLWDRFERREARRAFVRTAARWEASKHHRQQLKRRNDEI